MDKDFMLNKLYYAAANNELIKGKQGKMDLQLAKLIRIAISQILKEDTEFMTYTCNNLSDLARFLEIPPCNLYRDIDTITNKGCQSIVKIVQPDLSYDKFTWFSQCKWNTTTKTLTIQFNEALRPYLLQLQTWTQYQLENILTLSSYYAVRLYELIKCDDGITGNSKSSLNYSIEYLRSFFECENKYSRIVDFKKNVIDVAAREINANTDLYIIPEYHKSGRSIVTIEFEIHANSKLYRQRLRENTTNEK